MANQNGRPAAAATVDEPAAPADITQTPEFAMAIARAAAEIHERVTSEMRQILAQHQGPRVEGMAESELERFARLIAASTAELADQGTSRKRVAPEILEARAKATEKLYALLDKVQGATGHDRPKYRVRSKCYLGDRLIEPFQRGHRGEITPTYIWFMGQPSLGMEPANDVAREIYAAFQGTMLGAEAMINGKPTPDALAARPLWMTRNGAVIATPTATAREHGMIMEPDPLEVPETGLGPGVGQQVEIVDPHDPRATRIPVLGTIAPPAQRGTSSPRLA